MKNNNPKVAMGAYLAIGIGAGTAIGVAIGNPAIGIALGMAFGAMLGMIARAKRRNGSDGE